MTQFQGLKPPISRVLQKYSLRPQKSDLPQALPPLKYRSPPPLPLFVAFSGYGQSNSEGLILQESA